MTTHRMEGETLVPLDESRPRELRDPALVSALAEADTNWRTRLAPEAELIEHRVLGGPRPEPGPPGSLRTAVEEAPATVRRALGALPEHLAEHGKRRPHMTPEEWEAKRDEIVQRGIANVHATVERGIQATRAFEVAADQPPEIDGRAVATFELLTRAFNTMLPTESLTLARQLLDRGEHVDLVGGALRKLAAVPPSHFKPYREQLDDVLTHPALRDGGFAQRAAEARQLAAETRDRIIGAVAAFAYGQE